MHALARQASLAALRDRIAAIEKRPLAVGGGVPAGGRAVGEGSTVLAAPAGLLQEVYADAQRDTGAAFGFALGLARGLITPERPALLFLQLGHAAEAVGLPYGAGLLGFGIDPGALVLGRLKTLPELLWAIEEAVACRAVAAVVAEVLDTPKLLDFTASRRLSLRAAGAGASIFLLRHGRGREASAARLRWRIAPAASQAPPDDSLAPGGPRWRVSLEKGRLGPGGIETEGGILLDWTDHGFIPATAQPGGGNTGGRGVSRPAPSGAPPAALGDRLSEAG
jgi:protein ImuA